MQGAKGQLSKKRTLLRHIDAAGQLLRQCWIECTSEHFRCRDRISKRFFNNLFLNQAIRVLVRFLLFRRKFQGCIRKLFESTNPFRILTKCVAPKFVCD